MNPDHALAWLNALAAFPLAAYVAAELWRRSRRSPKIQTLRERAVTQTAVVVLLLVFSSIYLNNDLPIPFIDTYDTKLITRATTLVAGLAISVRWLLLHRNPTDRPGPPSG